MMHWHAVESMQHIRKKAVGGGEKRGRDSQNYLKGYEGKRFISKLKAFSFLSLQDWHNYFLISEDRTVVDVISIRKERLTTD